MIWKKIRYRGSLEISPDLKEQGKRFEGDRWYREGISKGNTGTFYVHLYAALFGGQIFPRYRGEHDVLPNGELRHIHPDIIRQEEQGETLVEVKSCSAKDSRPRITKEQTENYFYALIRKLLSTEQDLPEFEQAIFRYGSRGKHPFLFGYSTPSLIRRLSQTTRDLVVMPSNLVILALALSGRGDLGKSASKSRTKCVINDRYPCWFVRLLSASSNPVESLGYLAEKEFEIRFNRDIQFPDYWTRLSPKRREEILFEVLMLDKLRFQRFSSNKVGEFSCEGNPILPFQITQFYLRSKDHEGWIRKFRRSRAYLLEELLEIRNLFDETHEPPIRKKPADSNLPF